MQHFIGFFRILEFLLVCIPDQPFFGGQRNICQMCTGGSAVSILQATEWYIACIDTIQEITYQSGGTVRRTSIPQLLVRIRKFLTFDGCFPVLKLAWPGRVDLVSAFVRIECALGTLEFQLSIGE